MPRYPRYTSFEPGELQARLRELCPQAVLSSEVLGALGTGMLLKAHSFAITFPDTQPGTGRYERLGAQYHRFHFAYADGSSLPSQAYYGRLANTLTAIEAKGQELTIACYQAAIQQECKEVFQRASLPTDGSRKRCPEKYRMKAKLAIAQAGLYAVCCRLGDTLYVRSLLYDDMEKANAAWRERGDPRYVVACCNRLDRQWQVPKFNPLYAEYDPRPEFANTGKKEESCE